MIWRGAFLQAAATAAGAAKTALICLSYATLAFGIVFALASIAGAAWLLRRARARPAGAVLPPVTILKPLKGAERGLYENLASFCEQDYPALQMLCAVGSADDAALPVVERLRRDFPHLDIRVVVSDGSIGSNPKINNISNAYPLAKHEILLLSDSDIRVPRDFLRRAVAPFTEARVGLVTCFYRSVAAPGLWGPLEALAVNAQFLPQAMLAGAAGLRFAMGAATLVRRSVFERAGGFAALADRLADDFALGEIVTAAGFRIEFCDLVIESICAEGSRLGEIFHHLVRWQRTVRLCNPAGYCGCAILHGFSLTTLTLALFGWNARLAALAAALLGAKALAAVVLQRMAGATASPAALLWQAPSEWLACAAWLAGLAPGEVVWRGQRYRLISQGRLIPLDTLVAAP